MSILRKNQFYLFMLIFIIFIVLPLSAQEQLKGLIISEVYLAENHPANHWIELYNPTGKQLILEGLHFSHIRTINVLPPYIRKSGGIIVEPNEYLVLCADKTQFEIAWGNQVKPVVVKILSKLAKGGFIAISTKDIEEATSAGFRYGETLKSSHIKEYLGNQVLSFSKNDKSWSRKIIKTTIVDNISVFYESDPTPGQLNK